MLGHKPVLLKEVLGILAPQKGETYLDVTAGGGGHAHAVAQTLNARDLTLVDADPEAIVRLKQEFTQAKIYNNSFADQISQFANKSQKFDLILADLGLSSFQLDNPVRGFSFLHDGPLDMRFNHQQGSSLHELLENVSLEELTTIIRDYGQEISSKKIARQIQLKRPQTTYQLAQLVKQVKRQPFKRLHPATQTFMALRIWVNRELEELRVFLEKAPQLLNPGGRLAIISFHSLEDRLVKTTFKDLTDGEYDTDYRLKTKKPIVPPINSLVAHRQARSAKLRALERHK